MPRQTQHLTPLGVLMQKKQPKIYRRLTDLCPVTYRRIIHLDFPATAKDQAEPVRGRLAKAL